MGKVSQLAKPDTDDLRARVQAVLDGMSQTEFARIAGVSASTVGRWMKGTYEGDNDKVDRQFQSAVETITDRGNAQASLPTTPKFIETPTAARILDVLRYAHIASDVVVIYGGAGMGKTETARYMRDNTAGVWMVTITEATSYVQSTLEEIADAIGLPAMTGPGGRPAAATLYRAIVKRLTGTYGLLIVDESQNLPTKALDQIRQIHDATGCGLALLGNEKAYSCMTGGNRAAYLDRLFSRVGQKLRIQKAVDKDADAIIEAWGVKTSDCRKLLLQIAGTPGGLRSLTKTLRLASMFAAGDKRAVNCSDIRAAWKRLGGAS